MLPTHILVGLLFCYPVIYLYPDHTNLLTFVVIVGSSFPDLDMIIGQHRKTFHFPLLFISLIGISGILFLLQIFPYSLILFLIGLSGLIHILGDIGSSGLEKYPWKQNGSRAVYSVFWKKWISPTYILGYDGSKYDFVLLVFCTLVVAVLYPEFPYDTIFYGLCLITGGTYYLIRPKLPLLEDYLYENVPILRTIIDRFH